jgi:ferric-dicitrate binding protein FerR (iron transport regulator)
MSQRLDAIVKEARAELGVREAEKVDWDTVDRELFARLAQERRLEATRAVGSRAPMWGVAAVAVAAAACFALVAGKSHETRSLDAPVAVIAPPPAGSVVGILGVGDFLVDGKPAVVGTTLRLGDELEARGTSVTVDRPGKLTMVLEAGTKATVTHVQGSLVLALATGAVEAQVVPVPSGEAFAVDVAGSRVAVHGTHLRVSREDGRVVVDLNEGVVVLGTAPREGSTVGTLVTAPAHAAFVPGDEPQSLAVSHDPAAVRAPIALAPPPPVTAQGIVTPVATAAALPPSRPVPDGRGSPVVAPVGRPSAPPPAVAAAPAPTGPVADPNAASVLASTVRSCVIAHPSAENVTVVISTTLHLDLDVDGNVHDARFDPPVAGDVNACAAPVIYRTRFTHGGTADVPVDITVTPSGTTAPSSAP